MTTRIWKRVVKENPLKEIYCMRKRVFFGESGACFRKHLVYWRDCFSVVALQAALGFVVLAVGR